MTSGIRKLTAPAVSRFSVMFILLAGMLFGAAILDLNVFAARMAFLAGCLAEFFTVSEKEQDDSEGDRLAVHLLTTVVLFAVGRILEWLIYNT